MAGEAQISFSGFVHKDPELRFTPGGDAVASISVKVTPFKRGQDGSGKRGDPSWYRVSVWGKAGEAVAERVREGDRVSPATLLLRIDPDRYRVGAERARGRAPTNVCWQVMVLGLRWQGRRPPACTAKLSHEAHEHNHSRRCHIR